MRLAKSDLHWLNIAVAVVWLAFASSPRCALAKDPWLNLPGGNVIYDEEPVFKDQAFIYEVGRNHKKSVVLVHGLGDGAARDWEQLIPLLARQYHVVTFDLPGFGRSAKGNNLYSPATYTEFLHFIGHKYIDGPFMLVGHSMGGAIAARYASTYPDDVSRLVLVDAAGILHKVAFEKYVAASAVGQRAPEVYDALSADVRAIINFFVDAAEYIDLGPQLLLNAPPLRRTILGGNPTKIAALSLVLEDFSTLVPRIRQPTLLLWGEKDPVAPVRTGRVLEEVLPAATLQLFPGVGHAPMREAAEQFNKAVADFLAAKPQDITRREEKPRPAPKEGPLTCNEQSDLVVDGSFTVIEINGCKNVTLRNVFADKVIIRNSVVDMENVVIAGSDQGITAVNADVKMTNGSISANIAIVADESRFDIAGTRIKADNLLAKGNLPSNFVFSLVLAETPGQKRYLHDFVQISALKSL